MLYRIILQNHKRRTSVTMPIPSGQRAKRFDQPFAGLPVGRCFVTMWRSVSEYWLVYAQEYERCVLAHRMAVMLLVGNLDSQHLVLHRCGNPRCHHPNHLYVGGHGENQRDKILHQLSKDRADKFAMPARSDGVQIFTPKPLPLSREVSLLPAFSGFFPDDCFLATWLPPANDGYCHLTESSFSGTVVGAHRRSYLLFNGPLDKYDIVEHTCGDNKCLNPYHLFKSGRQQSIRDFNVKHDKRCKVTEYDMSLIMDRSKSVDWIAQELGIHRMTVANLRRASRAELF